MNIFPRSRQEVSVSIGFYLVPTLLEPDLSSVQYNDSDFISFKEGFVKIGVNAHGSFNTRRRKAFSVLPISTVSQN